NYCFFNALGVALSVLLLDDRLLLPALRWLCPSAPSPFFIVPAADAQNWIAIVVACLILPLSVVPMLRLFRVALEWLRPLGIGSELLDRFRLVNICVLLS